MMHDLLRFGGVTIANNARTYDYIQGMDCSEWTLHDKACPTLREFPGEPTSPSIAEAPWYDLADPDVSGRFAGVYVTSVRGSSDANRSTQVTEGIDDGATIGRTRRTAREVRVQAMLLAEGSDALEYGLAWLSAALDGGRCGQHGGGCGVSDLEYLTACPPEREPDETEEAYASRIEALRRFLHDVACTSGPLERARAHRGDWWRLDVEFTFTAGRPWVYSSTRPVDLPVTPTVVIQDTPYNLVPYPSAELADGAPVPVAINYATNPSLESSAVDWGIAADGTVVTLTRLTGGRIVGELAAVGTASYRSVFTANAAGAGGWMANESIADLDGPAGARYSINLWSAALVVTGTPSLGDIEFQAIFRDAGGAALRVDPLGTAPPEGGVASVKSILPPAGAADVVVRATLPVDSFANGNVVRLYSDALAVTVP